MKSCSGVAQWGTWCLPWLRPWCEGRHRANPQEFQQGGGNGGWDETDNPKLGLQQEFHLPGSVNITQPNSCSSGAGDSTISGMQIFPWWIHVPHPRGNLCSLPIPFQGYIKSSLTPRREFSEFKITDGKKLQLNNPNYQICFNICLAESSVWWEIKGENFFCCYEMLQCCWLLPVENLYLFKFIP